MTQKKQQKCGDSNEPVFRETFKAWKEKVVAGKHQIDNEEGYAFFRDLIDRKVLKLPGYVDKAAERTKDERVAFAYRRLFGDEAAAKLKLKGWDDEKIALLLGAV
jgi:hypothetical protein